MFRSSHILISCICLSLWFNLLPPEVHLAPCLLNARECWPSWAGSSLAFCKYSLAHVGECFSNPILPAFCISRIHYNFLSNKTLWVVQRKYWFIHFKDIFSAVAGKEGYHGICSDLSLEVEVSPVFSAFVSLPTH